MQRLLRGEIDDRHSALADFTLDLVAWNVHVVIRCVVVDGRASAAGPVRSAGRVGSNPGVIAALS